MGSDSTRILPNNSTSTVLLALISFCIWTVLASAFVLTYHAQENAIFFWDSDRYHGMFRFLIRTWNASGYLPVVKQMKWSLENDYSLLSSFLLSPLGLIFGEGRGVFLAGVASIYGFVAFGMTLSLYRALCSSREHTLDTTEWFVAGFCLALLPQFWLPILRGFPDVLGMGIMSGILFVHLLKPMWERPIWQMIAIGFVVAGSVWFRRWYAYFVIASILAILFDFILAFTSQKQRWTDRWKMIESFVVKGSIALGVAALLWYALSPQLLFTALTTSYRDLNSGWRSSRWEESLFAFYQQIGMTVSGFLALGLCFSFRVLDLKALGFIGVYLISGFFLFQSVQDFHPHDLYGLMPAISAIFLAAVTGLLKFSSSRFYKLFAAVCLVSLFALQLASSTVPEVSRSMGFFDEIFPKSKAFPIKRGDLAELRRLLDTFEKERLPDEKIYVLASSGVLNDGLLRSANDVWVGDPQVTAHILHSQDVDSRDGFPWRFFEAQLIVVPTPLQIHLRPDAQRNVRLLFDKMMNDINFRSRFERLPYTFNLDRQVEVSLYRLRRPFQSKDILLLFREYRGEGA
jgi:hypothetical protein